MTTDLKITENIGPYSAMLPVLKQARFGSYLILPFQFEENGFNSTWADKTLVPKDITTVDLNEIVRSMMSKGGHMSIGNCWMVPSGVLFREMPDSPLCGEQTSFYVDTENCSKSFSLTDSWLYVFHSRVAFFDTNRRSPIKSRTTFLREDERPVITGRSFSIAIYLRTWTIRGLFPTSP